MDLAEELLSRFEEAVIQERDATLAYYEAPASKTDIDRTGKKQRTDRLRAEVLKHLRRES